MKVLHTSDWHLGQSFYEHDRNNEHQRFLDWLVETLATEQIDVLIVCGDIFHTATPPASAENQLYSFIQTAKSCCPKLHIVIIAGNHDSASRIETAKPLLASFSTHVVGRFNRDNPTQALINLTIDDQVLHILAMPFLRSSELPVTKESGYQQGVQAAYQLLEREIKEISGPILTMGHLHAKGGTISEDSERNISIGGFESVSADVFGNNTSYVALGHLHKAQRIAQCEHIRYSGTPMPMSFSERDYKHQVLVAEFSDDRLMSVKPLYVPRFKDVIYLPDKGAADLKTICELIENFDWQQFPVAPYVRLRLSATEMSSQFRVEIEQALAGKPVTFCGIERVSESTPTKSLQLEDIASVERLSPFTLLNVAFQEIQGCEEDAPKEIHDKLAQVLAELEEEQG
ncbi:exonuclease subunit SbcD (plasmid) [Pseudoalteromonas sp. T1lg65]|uniref:exonuclease subunit SbcD n=1 Tax=Pseudoalteromonas sp. T1lg65 TaxID=2077101 RepID=UPI003F791F75